MCSFLYDRVMSLRLVRRRARRERAGWLNQRRRMSHGPGARWRDGATANALNPDVPPRTTMLGGTLKAHGGAFNVVSLTTRAEVTTLNVAVDI